MSADAYDANGTIVHDLLERLQGTHAPGISLAKLLLWSTHLEVAVGMLEEAADDLADPANLAEYIKPGWWRTKARANERGIMVSVPNEDAITDAIVERIHQLKEIAPDGSVIAANRTMSIRAQELRRGQAGIGPLGLKDTDITAYRFDQIGLDLRIEAKVVFDGDDLTKEYLSDRGILRFADAENPYTREVLGGMVSYCVTKAGGHWRDQIATGLRSLPSVEDVGRVARVGSDASLLCCDVRRGGGACGRVTVIHFELRFQTDPSSHEE